MNKIEEILHTKDSFFTSLYYVAFALLCTSRGVDILNAVEPLRSLFEFTSNVLSIASVAAFVPCVFTAFVSFGALAKFWTICIGVFLFSTGSFAAQYYLLWAFLMVLGSNKKNLVRLAKIAVIVSLATIFTGLLISGLGLSAESIFTRGGEVRSALGFSHPNRFAQAMLSVGIGLFVICSGKCKKSSYIALVFLAITTWIISKSRTAVLGFIVIAVVLGAIPDAVSHLGGKCRRQLPKMMGIFVFGIMTVSVIAMAAYDPGNQVQVAIDKILSGRLSFPHELYETLTGHLFGFDLSDSADYVDAAYLSSQGTIPVDNVFCSLYFRFGPFALVLFSIFYLFPFFNHKGSPNLVLYGLLLNAMLGFSENYVYDPAFNYFLLGIGWELFEQRDFRLLAIKNLVRDEDHYEMGKE